MVVTRLRFLSADFLLEDTQGRSGLSGTAWAMWGLTIHVPLSTSNIRIVTVNLLEWGENGTGGPCKTVVLAWETGRLCLAQTEEAHRSISVQALLTVFLVSRNLLHSHWDVLEESLL